MPYPHVRDCPILAIITSAPYSRIQHASNWRKFTSERRRKEDGAASEVTGVATGLTLEQMAKPFSGVLKVEPWPRRMRNERGNRVSPTKAICSHMFVGRPYIIVVLKLGPKMAPKNENPSRLDLINGFVKGKPTDGPLLWSGLTLGILKHVLDDIEEGDSRPSILPTFRKAWIASQEASGDREVSVVPGFHSVGQNNPFCDSSVSSLPTIPPIMRNTNQG